MPGAAAEAEHNPPSLDWGESRPLSQREERTLQRAYAYHEQIENTFREISQANREELSERDLKGMLDFILARLKNEVSLKTLQTFLERLRRQGPEYKVYKMARRFIDED